MRVGRGGTAVLDARFRDGAGVLVDADPVTVDISNPSEVEVVSNASPTTNPSTGVYTYNYAVAEDAPLGVWTITWSGVVNDVAVSGNESFEVVDAGTVDVSGGDTYATLAELKSRLQINTSSQDAELLDVLLAASRAVDAFCGRSFADSGAVSTRTFRAITGDLAYVDDFHTTTGLVIATDPSEDASFSAVWAATDYQLEPLGGVMDGITGWPHSRIVAVGNHAFGVAPGRTLLRVTARWGWAAVPAPVKQATLILAEELYKLRDAPFGVAGFDQYGAVRVRDNPRTAALLQPYVRYAVA